MDNKEASMFEDWRIKHRTEAEQAAHRAIVAGRLTPGPQTIVVYDDATRSWVQRDVVVFRAINLVVNDGNLQRRADDNGNRHFSIIICRREDSDGLKEWAYIRGPSDGFFRLIGMAGALSAEIVDAYSL
jgi:hypothetical protein